MRQVLLGLPLAALLVLLAESEVFGSPPSRPAGWLLAAVALPVAVEWLRGPRANPARASRLARWTPPAILPWALAGFAVLVPLGWGTTVIHDLGWSGNEFASAFLLLFPLGILSLLAAVPSLASRGRDRLPIPCLLDRARFAGTAAAVFLALLTATHALESIPEVRDLLEARTFAWAGPATILLAALSAALPWLASLAVSTASMPGGSADLEELARAAGVPMRRAQVCFPAEPFGFNAFALGLIPRSRTVYFTHGMAESLDRDEIRAVFVHELGHLRARHAAWHLALGCAVLASLDPLALVLDPVPESIRLSILALYVLAISTVGFGRMSRRFELEADREAARAIEPGRYAAVLAALLPLAGGTSGSWRHPSLGRRIAAARAAESTPALPPGKSLGGRRLRLAVAVYLASSLAAAGWAWIDGGASPRGSARIALAADALGEARSLAEGIASRRAEGGSRISPALAWLARPDAAIERDAREALARARRHLESAPANAAADGLLGEIARIEERLRGSRSPSEGRNGP